MHTLQPLLLLLLAHACVLLTPCRGGSSPLMCAAPIRPGPSGPPPSPHSCPLPPAPPALPPLLPPTPAAPAPPPDPAAAAAAATPAIASSPVEGGPPTPPPLSAGGGGPPAVPLATRLLNCCRLLRSCMFSRLSQAFSAMDCCHFSVRSCGSSSSTQRREAH